MKSIQWANYTDTDFTLFCNALLSFEIGKRFEPFSAPGSDGGIDGRYEGTYAGYTGRWRFQYKFHKVARKQGFHALKADLAGEIRNIKNEDYLVLMTNVELLPQEHDELNTLFNIKKGKEFADCQLLVWDGAGLFNKYLQHPLLDLWLDEGFQTSPLLPYQVVFKKEMEMDSYRPGTLANYFVPRERAVSSLQAFMASGAVMALIIGEAGIGKTRLVLEFFKQLAEHDESDWSPLVLATRKADISRLKKALSSDQRFVILIDDAHSYSADAIKDLKLAADTMDGRIKLLLTVRSLEAYDSLTQIKEYEKDGFPHINLARLLPAETSAALEKLVADTGYHYYLNDLVRLTHGRPILLVAILNAIQEGLSISLIREGSFLRSYVQNYFNTFYEKTSQLTGLSVLNIKLLLQHIALIEPFSFNDARICSKLSELHKIDGPVLSIILKHLVDYGFVSGKYEQAIRPDYYSDILLSDIDPKTATFYITEFSASLDNIIINLSSVDEISAEPLNLLDDILNKYVEWINTDDIGTDPTRAHDLTEIKRVLDTIQQIIYIKPAIGKKTVDVYLASLQRSGHPVQLEMELNARLAHPLTETSLGKIRTILSRLLTFPAEYDFVASRSFNLYQLTGDKHLPAIYEFTKWDIVDHFRLSRQQYFVARLQKQYLLMSVKNSVFAAEVLRKILALDFTLTELSAANTDTMLITTYMIPESDTVYALRLNIVGLLDKLYDAPHLSENKSLFLNLLLGIPGAIAATERNAHPYRHDTEIGQVLDILEKYTDQYSLLEQKDVLDKLYWYVRWKVDEKFLPQIERIKLKMRPRNLAEELAQLFTRDEVLMLKQPNLRTFLEEKCDDFVQNNSMEAFALGITAFLAPQPYTPYYFGDFMSFLQRKHTAYAVYLHDHLWEIRSALYYRYASGILCTLYFEIKDEEAYWQRIQQLQQVGSADADNVILQVYATRVPGTAILTEQDIDTILTIYRKNNTENHFTLASALQSLIVAGYPDTQKILGDFLDSTGQRQAEMFFIWLSDNQVANPVLVRDLMLEHTVRFDLNYEIEQSLNNILKEFGTKTIFGYLVRRFEWQKQIYVERQSLIDYHFVPHGQSYHLFTDCEEQKIPIFLEALDWYIELNYTDNLAYYYAKNMLEYLRPGQSISTGILYDEYVKRIDAGDNNLNSLKKISESLEIFDHKSGPLISLVVRLYDQTLRWQETNDKLYREVRYSLYAAITQVGVKSGISGSPFQVDLDLKALLEKEIGILPEYEPARLFLKEVLNSVNKDIERDREGDEIC